MDKAIAGLLILVSLTQLAPIVGVLGAERLASLYGISFEEPNLLILMRHRAVLFGLLGSFILYSAFRPALQPLAMGAAFVAIAAFIAIGWSVGGMNEPLRRLVVGDSVALVALLVAAALRMLSDR